MTAMSQFTTSQENIALDLIFGLLGESRINRTEQARPETGHPYQQSAVNAVQSKTRRRPPQRNIELMAEKQILGFKPTPRREQISDEHSECVQDRKHRLQ